jgi:hypothetical protein
MLSAAIISDLSAFLRGTSGKGPLVNWPPHPPAAITDTKLDPTLKTALAEARAKYVGKNRAIGLAAGLAAGVTVFDPAARFYGWNLDMQCALGSGSKLMILYAAFQLRDDVRKVAAAGFTDAADLRVKLVAAWSASKVPPLVALAGEVRAADKAPFIDQIFDLSDPAKIDFLGMRNCGLDDIHQYLTTHPGTAGVLNLLDNIHQGEYDADDDKTLRPLRWLSILTLKFAKRLWLTTRWSDNAAAYSCATEIGMPYVYALMKGSKLYSASNRRGMRLFLAGYELAPVSLPDPSVAAADPAPDDPDKQSYAAAAQLLRRCQQSAAYRPADISVADFAKKGQGQIGKQDGTIRTLSALMGAIVQGGLIEPAASDGSRGEASKLMASFLRVSSFVVIPSPAPSLSTHAGSYVMNALQAWKTELNLPSSGSRYTDAWSKIGVVKDTADDTGIFVRLYSDWAFLSFKAPTPPLPKNLGIVLLNYNGIVPKTNNSSSLFNRCVRDIVLSLEQKPLLP